MSYYGSWHIRYCINYVKTKKTMLSISNVSEPPLIYFLTCHPRMEGLNNTTGKYHITGGWLHCIKCSKRQLHYIKCSKRNCDDFFDVDLNAPLNKWWLFRWFGTPWHSCDIIALVKLWHVYCVCIVNEYFDSDLNTFSNCVCLMICLLITLDVPLLKSLTV